MTVMAVNENAENDTSLSLRTCYARRLSFLINNIITVLHTTRTSFFYFLLSVLLLRLLVLLHAFAL